MTNKEIKNDKYEQQKKKTTLFLTKLPELIGEENIKPKRFAETTHLTVPFASNLLRGLRSPSLDTLCAIAVGFKLPFEEVAYCLVADGSIRIDEENGKRNITIFIMNNGRGPTAGSIKILNEEELENFYGDEYTSEQFLHFVKKYLIEKLYIENRKDKYYDRMDYIRKKFNAPTSIDDKMNSSGLFRDIITKLNNMDDSGLQFIKDQIDIYMKHYNN